jgi:hypothetical protein
VVTCVTSTSHGGNGSFKRPREKGTMPMRKPHTCGKRGGERRAEHLHAKVTMPMRNQAHLEQLRPDGVRGFRARELCAWPVVVAAHLWGRGGGAVVSTRASARPRSLVVRPAGYNQEAIKRPSGGHQEAIRRSLTTHHDRAPCGLGSEPLVESGGGGVARSARRVDLKVA